MPSKPHSPRRMSVSSSLEAWLQSGYLNAYALVMLLGLVGAAT